MTKKRAPFEEIYFAKSFKIFFLDFQNESLKNTFFDFMNYDCLNKPDQIFASDRIDRFSKDLVGF